MGKGDRNGRNREEVISLLSFRPGRLARPVLSQALSMKAPQNVGCPCGEADLGRPHHGAEP